MENHPPPDRDQLLNLIESLRASMTTNLAQLDQLTAAVLAIAPAAPASPHRRRTVYRGAAIVPTDIDRAKAKAALARMGMKP